MMVEVDFLWDEIQTLKVEFFFEGGVVVSGDSFMHGNKTAY